MLVSKYIANTIVDIKESCVMRIVN